MLDTQHASQVCKCLIANEKMSKIVGIGFALQFGMTNITKAVKFTKLEQFCLNNRLVSWETLADWTNRTPEGIARVWKSIDRKLQIQAQTQR